MVKDKRLFYKILFFTFFVLARKGIFDVLKSIFRKSKDAR